MRSAKNKIFIPLLLTGALLCFHPPVLPIGQEMERIESFITTEEAQDLQPAKEEDMLQEDGAPKMQKLKGKTLQKGDCIGIIPPAFYTKDNFYNQALLFLKSLGYEIKLSSNFNSKYGYLGGTDEERAKALNDLFSDPQVDAIFCVRGGYGCARMLDYLDYEMIAKHPKLLMGYSDVTALHVALMQRCNLVTVHGPMLTSLSTIYSDAIANQKRKAIPLLGGLFTNPLRSLSSSYITSQLQRGITAEDIVDGKMSQQAKKYELAPDALEGLPLSFTVSEMLKGLNSAEPMGEMPMPEGESLKALVPGSATGLLVGGNLALISSMAGTDYELKGDHCILFLEEVNESAYRIDRMLNQLYQNGLLDRVDGILLGDMSTNQDNDDRTVSQVIEEYAHLCGKPFITGVPAGHGAYNLFLPFNVTVTMTALESGEASVTFLEAPLVSPEEILEDSPKTEDKG